MRVAVDADRCAGYGICTGHAPAAFALGDVGYAEVAVDEVPVEHQTAVRRAAAECPTGAITIIEETDV